ncbi:hypothetical protein HQ590_13410, partial [bacterium]|nr:hypothetical protein [bacterium]
VCLEAGVPDPAAAYFADEGCLYTASDFLPERGVDRLQLLLAVVQALQDQNLMVTGTLARAQENHDRYWAWQALYEGDARLALNEVAGPGETTPLVAALRDWERERAERLKGAPSFLQQWLLFPERYGPPFVATLHARGGKALVREVFADPPVSSEQILHPERYLVFRDDPTPVGLAALEVRGWRPAGSDVLGEFGIRSLLETQLDQVTARLAAQGWDGDRYIVYLRADSQASALVWRTIWDTEQDAFEFEDALRAFAAARWGQEPDLIVRGVYVTVIQSRDAEFLAAARAAWAAR